MKLLCLYQVMFQYRVGTYDAISQLPGVDFELWHGKDVPNSKKKNYKGEVRFKHKQLSTVHLPFKTNNGEGSMPYFPFLFFRLIKKNPDVILTEGASSLLASSVAYIYCKLFRKKIIWWTMGGLKGRVHKGIRAFLQGWISHMERNSDAVFAYSTQAKAYLLTEGVRDNKIFVGVNVIDTSKRQAEILNHPVEKAPGFNLVFVGAINKTKRLEVLVDAVAQLKKRYSDIHLHIIGDGNYMDVIRKHVEVAGLNDDVVFHGRVTKGLGTLLSENHVMVLPGLGGLAIVDGMIASLPIISGPADGTELDLIDKTNGFVTSELMTADYIVNKVSILHENRELCESMGESSYSRITNDYSFEKYIGVFSKCLSFVSGE